MPVLLSEIKNLYVKDVLLQAGWKLTDELTEWRSIKIKNLGSRTSTKEETPILTFIRLTGGSGNQGATIGQFILGMREFVALEAHHRQAYFTWSPSPMYYAYLYCKDPDTFYQLINLNIVKMTECFPSSSYGGEKILDRIVAQEVVENDDILNKSTWGKLDPRFFVVAEAIFQLKTKLKIMKPFFEMSNEAEQVSPHSSYDIKTLIIEYSDDSSGYYSVKGPSTKFWKNLEIIGKHLFQAKKNKGLYFSFSTFVPPTSFSAAATAEKGEEKKTLQEASLQLMNKKVRPAEVDVHDLHEAERGKTDATGIKRSKTESNS